MVGGASGIAFNEGGSGGSRRHETKRHLTLCFEKSDAQFFRCLPDFLQVRGFVRQSLDQKPGFGAVHPGLLEQRRGQGIGKADPVLGINLELASECGKVSSADRLAMS